VVETSVFKTPFFKTGGTIRTGGTMAGARRSPRRAALLAGAAAAVLALSGPARAYDTTLGDWQINIDTTLSSSVDIRTSPIDYNFVGSANPGGRFLLANNDNGTLNYRDGSPVAAVQRITTEVQAKKDDYGFFIRATGFYDPVNESETTDHIPLSSAARTDIGADLRLLDAYAFARPSVFGHPIDVRVGAQALNWGESTFIQFGINSINPLDATALRTPGSELRQGFLPIPVVDLKTEIGGGYTLEGFWQFAWTRSKLEPDGSFFGNNDSLLDGGNFGNLRNDFPDNQQSIYGINQAAGDLFGASLNRSLDRHPTSLDEFGFALRKTFSSLDDAEFGLYFENYHSRTPFGSNRTGSANVNGGGSVFFNGALSALPEPIGLAFPGAPAGYALHTYTSTASFFADYPKDIHLVGVSWNFTGPAGVAVQGEVSSRLNQPIQLAASDLALLTNVPAIRQTQPVSPALLGAVLAEACADPTIQADGGCNVGNNQIIDGWKRYPVIQAQTTATKLFNSIPSLSINSLVLVGEVGFDYVANFPRNRAIFDAAYTTDVNSAFEGAATVNSATKISTKGFASQFSGAYTVAMIVDMPNVLPYAIDMKPTISLQHDFAGTSPVGVNVFVQNTAAASIGVTFNYLQAWSLGVQYTNHFPIFDGGKEYGLQDRDFVSAVVSYEF
jgi:hypothetical protein